MTEPIRMCLACRRRAAQATLVRLVVDRGTVAVDSDRGTVAVDSDRGTVAVDSDRGTVAVDQSARRPGRGAYLCGRDECLDRALRRDGAALHRSLRVSSRDAAVDSDALRAQWAAAVRSSTITATHASANAVRETA